jgi:hypothetical protein
LRSAGSGIVVLPAEQNHYDDRREAGAGESDPAGAAGNTASKTAAASVTAP